MTLRVAAIESAVRTLGQLRVVDPAFSNPRTFTGLAPSDIVELAASIYGKGVLTPLLIVSDGLVIAGQRRYRALELLDHWQDSLELTHALSQGVLMNAPDKERIDQRIDILTEQIPVRIVWHGAIGTLDPAQVDRAELVTQLEGIALADNLLRSDLSSYEIAARLAVLHGQGVTGIQLARLIGKSAAYVSRKLSAWRKASKALRAAWKDGLSEDQVEQIAALPFDDQDKALAGPIPRGRRGPAHRPSVDAVRDFLLELEQRPQPPGKQLAIGAEAREIAYQDGVRDALRWATGATSSPEFAKLAGGAQ